MNLFAVMEEISKLSGVGGGSRGTEVDVESDVLGVELLGQSFILSGEAGVGKTTILNDFVADHIVPSGCSVSCLTGNESSLVAKESDLLFLAENFDYLVIDNSEVVLPLAIDEGLIKQLIKHTNLIVTVQDTSLLATAEQHFDGHLRIEKVSKVVPMNKPGVDSAKGIVGSGPAIFWGDVFHDLDSVDVDAIVDEVYEHLNTIDPLFSSSTKALAKSMVHALIEDVRLLEDNKDIVLTAQTIQDYLSGNPFCYGEGWSSDLQMSQWLDLFLTSRSPESEAKQTYEGLQFLNPCLFGSVVGLAVEGLDRHMRENEAVDSAKGNK